jgi:uncharacterized membrane protein
MNQTLKTILILVIGLALSVATHWFFDWIIQSRSIDY